MSGHGLSSAQERQDKLHQCRTVLGSAAWLPADMH